MSEKTYRRKCYFDSNNYLTSPFYSMKLDGKNEYDLTIEILHSDRLDCWHLVNGQLVYDTEKANKQIDRENKLQELADLKKKLADSDYYRNVIAEGDRDEDYYAELIADRHTWRLRVRELEEELGL